MKEFKNLNELVELSKDDLDNNNKEVHAVLDFEDLIELRDLIIRNKQLENIFALAGYDIKREDDHIPRID